MTGENREVMRLCVEIDRLKSDLISRGYDLDRVSSERDEAVAELDVMRSMVAGMDSPYRPVVREGKVVDYRATRPALVAAALAEMAANRAYRVAWNAFFRDIAPCDDAAFDRLLPAFLKEVFVYRVGHGRSDGIEDAAFEFFRKALYDGANYSYEDALAFVKGYEAIKAKLDRALSKHFDYCGDGYGDLIDSLPLAGPHFLCFVRVKGEAAFSDEEGISRASGSFISVGLAAWVGRDISPRELARYTRLLEGENYVSSRLEAAAMRYFSSLVLRGAGDDIDNYEIVGCWEGYRCG